MKDQRASLQIIIKGRVQGVAFRWYTMKKAFELGIQGYVMNRNDGDVEAVFQGSTGDVDSMLKWCASGPPSAIVENITILEDKVKKRYKTFDIRY